MMGGGGRVNTRQGGGKFSAKWPALLFASRKLVIPGNPRRSRGYRPAVPALLARIKAQRASRPRGGAAGRASGTEESRGTLFERVIQRSAALPSVYTGARDPLRFPEPLACPVIYGTAAETRFRLLDKPISASRRPYIFQRLLLRPLGTTIGSSRCGRGGGRVKGEQEKGGWDLGRG
ncbi:hypothetical protein KM043_002614 [Ampulex compressa]|nr:hypothetical protein KM043_002614 [Ampulex compressa]